MKHYALHHCTGWRHDRTGGYIGALPSAYTGWAQRPVSLSPNIEPRLPENTKFKTRLVHTTYVGVS